MSNQSFSFYRYLRQLIEYNRHLIAGYRLSAKDLSDKQWAFRLVFISIAILLGAYISFAFGEALSVAFPLENRHWVGWHTLLTVGTGWILMGLASRLWMELWLEYWGHLATTMLVGVLMFVPWELMHWLFFAPWPVTISVGAFVSFCSMAWLHSRRVKLLQLHWHWNLAWFASVLGCFIIGNWYFYA